MQKLLIRIATYNKLETAMSYLVNHMILAQYEIRKIELFGQALKAIEKEMKHFNHQNVISPVHVSELTKQQNNRALILMFLKQKRDGSIKGGRLPTEENSVCGKTPQQYHHQPFQSKHFS